MEKSRQSLLMGVGIVVATVAVIVGAIFVSHQQGFPTAQLAGQQAGAEPDLLPMPTLGDDGMWIEAWEHPSSGDLARDAQLAAAEGKLLAVFWERAGCPYCLQLHTHDYRLLNLYKYVSQRFYVVRLDFYGTKPIRDIDGVSAGEHELALRHRVQGTPTMEFRTADGKEVLRIPGYVEPRVMESAFEFAYTGAYRQTKINDWLRERDLL